MFLQSTSNPKTLEILPGVLQSFQLPGPTILTGRRRRKPIPIWFRIKSAKISLCNSSKTQFSWRLCYRAPSPPPTLPSSSRPLSFHTLLCFDRDPRAYAEQAILVSTFIAFLQRILRHSIENPSKIVSL